MSTYLDDIAYVVRSELAEGVVIPDDSDYLFVLYAVLVRAKGEQASLSDVHDCWSAWMQCRSKNHKSLVPFETLDAETQGEDRPYLEAIHRAARQLRSVAAKDD